MIFYNLFICLLSFGLKVFSWFNEKAKKGVDGRKRKPENSSGKAEKSESDMDALGKSWGV